MASPSALTFMWMFAALEDSAKVGAVRCARAQALDRRRLVAECLEKRERKVPGLEGPCGQRGNRFLDLDSVHGSLQVAARIRNRHAKSHLRAFLKPGEGAQRCGDRRQAVSPFTNSARPLGNDASTRPENRPALIRLRPHRPRQASRPERPVRLWPHFRSLPPCRPVRIPRASGTRARGAARKVRLNNSTSSGVRRPSSRPSSSAAARAAAARTNAPGPMSRRSAATRTARHSSFVNRIECG